MDEQEQTPESDDLSATSAWLLEVTDLKQLRYCPRILFYRYCLPRVRPVTFKMEHGIIAHEEEADREARRSLQLYDLPAGERFTSVRLADPALGLHGKLDLVIATPDRADAREIIPVEYKWSTQKPGPHFRLQLAAYALLLEKCWGFPVQRGFIYLAPLRQVTEVPITANLRRQVVAAVAQAREIIKTTELPAPPRSAAPCVSCEFRRFCNDVI